MNHWTLQVFSHPNPMDLAEMPHMQNFREAQATSLFLGRQIKSLLIKTMMIL